MKKSIPKWILEEQKKSQVLIEYATTKALIKMQDYKKKDEIYKGKYKMSFEDFEKTVLSSKEENFTKWDDYLEWKAFHSAYIMWAERYKSITNV